MKFLELLSRSFPTIAAASTEIINLQAILHLPKGTEHFLADIHGEYEAFHHVLKTASGNIRRKVEDLFGTTLREAEKRQLCTLIYYPAEKLSLSKGSYYYKSKGENTENMTYGAEYLRELLLIFGEVFQFSPRRVVGIENDESCLVCHISSELRCKDTNII